MDTKGRIGLGIAVIATAISLVLAMVAVAQTPPANSNSPLKNCFGTVAVDQTVIKDRTFTSPSTCAAHGNLDLNNFMNALCASARDTWTSLTQNKCSNFMQPLPCRMSGNAWLTTHNPSQEKRTCEEDPGHFSKLICTIKYDAICVPPGQCEKDCESIKIKELKQGCMRACTNF